MRDRLRARLPEIALLALWAGFATRAALGTSAVADELGGHLDSGWLYWTTGVYSGGIANFPLGHLWSSALAVLLGRPHELLTDQSLLWFRIPGLLLGLGVGWMVWSFARRLFGVGPARWALALYAVSPNLLAHASLATLDFPLAAAFFAAVVAARAQVEDPRPWRVLPTALALPAAVTLKVQGLLALPLVLGLVAGWRWGCRDLRRLAWELPVLVGVPWLGIHAVYGGLPGVAGWLPEPWLAALRFKLEHGRGALSQLQVAYLLGETSTSGWWYWFPVALAVKTPLPTMLLSAWGAARAHGALWFVGLPPLALLGLAMAGSVNIGIRHVLAVLPFLIVLAGLGAHDLTRRRGGLVVVGVLLASLLVETTLQSPNHLSYFHLLAGGPSGGERILVDSNLDWGQSDPPLRRWVDAQERPVHINPDPHAPTAGLVVVNANARAGIYGAGGRAAYAWLDGLEPVERVGVVWSVYDVPAGWTGSAAAPGPGSPNQLRPWAPTLAGDAVCQALRTVRPYVADLSRRHGDVANPRAQHLLAWSLAQCAAYDLALERMRTWVRHHPADQTALGIGGEILVQWKLGVLHFHGTEYLDGVVTGLEPVPPFDAVVDAAHRAGLAPALADLHRTLSQVVTGPDRDTVAADLRRRAARFHQR